jgi:MFS family permease
VAISLGCIPRSQSYAAARIDWTGALVASIGLGGLVFGFIESANLGWLHPLVLGSLLVGFGCLMALVFVEARVSSPMVPLTLFESRSFVGANLLTLFLYSAIGIFFFLFPLNLIQVQRYSSTGAGAAVLPLILLMFLLSRWSGGLVARYGPRNPLILGPLIAAVGFSLFAIPSVGDSYWKVFFPAIIVLGFGMAVTVAPLTTVVMSSVTQERVGTASGVNNAVARVAGVLAIAVLGIVMVHAFGSRLNRSLSYLSLPPAIEQQVKADEIKLAGLQVPADLSPETRSAISESIGAAFVFGFRIVMVICAALALASAATSWHMIPRSK